LKKKCNKKVRTTIRKRKDTYFCIARERRPGRDRRASSKSAKQRKGRKFFAAKKRLRRTEKAAEKSSAHAFRKKNRDESLPEGKGNGR